MKISRLDLLSENIQNWNFDPNSDQKCPLANLTSNFWWISSEFFGTNHNLSEIKWVPMILANLKKKNWSLDVTL